ncbi:RiPP maturation radical SAM C-methyltransferase [Kitasatospora sp. NPDC058444]|uniref:RiPP maturation radical SAM C-methyltransferase n=1 Tax=Kitasatospora sp. NPDC058444 TaxID=3346504 RepID=UPI0036564712
MRIALVSMPWQALEMPSLQVGLLHALVTRERPADEVAEYHGWLRWAEFLLEHSDGELTPTEYMTVADDQVFDGFGDWVFSGCLYDDDQWGTEQLTAYAARTGSSIDSLLRMRPHAARFIAEAARDVLATDPDVVGMTTTFLQNVPSLALAREIKRLRPEVVTVLGGSNCDSVMGHALHRNHPFLDHVVRGEAERAFPALLAHIERGTAPADVPGVCWWDGGTSRANREPRGTVPIGLLPSPDFDAWQESFDSSPVAEFVEPKLVVEGARGCWWGEKHHCTFCGLNGSLMEFRSKSGEQLWSEIERLVHRHKLLDVITVDNIISMDYFRDFLPRAAESAWDLRIHYEVKSNLSQEQIALLGRARVTHVQPGIESLNSRVLGLMDKGVTGARNVRTMRECENHALTCVWNYLYGFPGERDEDYTEIIDQMPALRHLQPPGGATRIALERFSPHFTNPALGFTERRPADIYQHVYQLPREELEDLVYLFDAPATGIQGELERRLVEEIDRWTEAYPSSRLLLEPVTDGPDGGDGEQGDLLVHDEREGWPRRTHRLTHWRAAAFRELEHGRTPAALHRRLAEAGYEVPLDELTAWGRELLAHGLVFKDGDTLLALPTRAVPVRAPGVGAAFPAALPTPEEVA